MIRSLRDRIYSNMQNYKRPDAIEHTATELRAFAILNKKAAPKKKLTLSQKKAYKVLKAPKKKSTKELIKECKKYLSLKQTFLEMNSIARLFMI